MPKLIPDDGDKIVLISPDGIEYPGTIEKRDTLHDYEELYAMCFKLNTRLDSSHLWRGWRIRLEDEDRSFTDFGAFLNTDRSGGNKMNLEIGSSAWYVAGARFADGDSIVSVQFVTVRDVLEFDDGSRMYVIDFCRSIYSTAEKLFADREKAEAEAIRLQKLKIMKARELLEVHIRWLDRLENP